MKIRNVSPLGDVFNPITGPVEAGGVVDVDDALVEEFGLIASGNFAPVRKSKSDDALEG